ncbi:MAG: molybdopterin cofactor-binding domain-containing protein, partial [Dehalococcoidia bacterium]
MSDSNAAGLTIRGAAGLGLPLPATGYARSAYGNVVPDFGPSTWLTVAPDGVVRVFAGKVEYGQGIRWGLAIAAAEELGLEPGDVEVVLGDTERVPWDIGTFGSQSTRHTGVQVRKAAATARQALLELAAARLDLPTDQLACAGGSIISTADTSRSVTFAALLEGQLLVRDIPDDVDVRAAADFSVMGHDWQRVDAVERVTGRAIYTQDVLRPGMLFAKILRPPAYGARLRSFDGSVAERMPGVVSVIQDERLVAVLAESDEAADRAHDLITSEWDEPDGAISQWELPARLDAESRDPVTTQEAGDVEAALARSAHRLEATYYVPYISIAPMEPRAAVAEWEGDRLTLWAGTQRPFGVRAEMAVYFGIDEANVQVIAPEI